MRRLWIALCFTLAIVPVAACTNSSSEKPKELVIGASAEPPTLDPTTNATAAIPQALLYNVYQTLVRVDAEGKLQPLLAEGWQMSTDNRTYTFQLRGGIKFASGDPVTAEDVIANFKRVKSAKGIVPTLAGQMAVIEQMDVPQEGTVRVRLSKPSNMWLFDISSRAGIIADPKHFDELESATAGSGPFELASLQKGQSLTLKRNQNYWGTQPHFDQIKFRYFSDPNALTAAMLSGGVDVISDLTTPQSISQFSDKSKYQVIEGTTNGEVVLGFNFKTPALQNLKVRQAINHAIDREALMKVVWNGYGTKIGSMVPPTDPWYTDLADTYPYNPEKAKQLLGEAGVGKLKLRLRVPTLPYAPPAAQVIASQLKEVGIEVVVDELEFPARWIDLVYTKGDYDMTIVAHVEPRDIVKFADPKYYWHYDDPEVQRLVAEADSGSPEEQVTNLRAASERLADQAAADWLFLLPNLIVAKAELSGISQNATSLSFDVTNLASR